MPATSTLRQYLIETVERFALGKVVPVSSNTTTAFTLTTTGSPELRGPFSGAGIAVGSPVICTVETSGTTALGNRTYVSNWSPSTGVLTVSPPIGDTDVTEIIVLKPWIKDPDRLIEGVNRTMKFRCKRQSMQPLTFVPDGDMLFDTIATYWTASAGTATYQTLAVPETVGRCVQISHSSSATLTSNTIPARAADTWYFETAIRTTTDGDTAALSILDVTNSTTITPTYQIGDGTTTSRAFQALRGVFTVPGTADTDARIGFRLTVSGSGTMTAQMAPIIAFPQNAMSFPLQQRVRTTDHIGNFHYAYGYSSTGGPDERTYSDPITTMGRTHSFSAEADHFVVYFGFPLANPVYYEDHIAGYALSALTDTSNFDLDYVARWTYAELLGELMRDEIGEGKVADNGVPLPSRWRPLYNAAVKSAKWSEHEPNLVNVLGRR